MYHVCINNFFLNFFFFFLQFNRFQLLCGAMKPLNLMYSQAAMTDEPRLESDPCCWVAVTSLC